MDDTRAVSDETATPADPRHLTKAEEFDLACKVAETARTARLAQANLSAAEAKRQRRQARNLKNQ